MDTEQSRKMLVRAFPPWLHSLFKCVPVRITERKLVLMCPQDELSPGLKKRLQEIAGSLTSRTVELEPAGDGEVSSQVVLEAAVRNLVNWFARLEVMFELVRDGQAKIADLAKKINTRLALLGMLCDGTFEAHRGSHPAWAKVTGASHKESMWSLTLNADGILWPSLYLADDAMCVLLRTLSADPPAVSGRELEVFGLPENIESAESFTLSFPRI